MSDNSLTKQLVRGAKWTTCSNISNSIVKLLQTSVLAHLLTPGDFGLIAIANVFISFAEMIAEMGLTVAVLHFQKITDKQYSTIFWINVLLSATLSMTIFLFKNVIASAYDNSEVGSVISVLCFNMFLMNVSRLHRTYSQKDLQFRKISIIEIIGAVTACGVSVGLAFMGWGVYSIVWATLITSALTSTLYILKTPALNKRLSFYCNLRDVSDFLKVGGYQFLTTVVSYFACEIDVLFVSAYFSTEFLGCYSICKTLCSRIYSILNPIITRVTVPALAKIQEDKNRLCSIFTMMIKIASFINFPIYGLMAVVSYYLLFFLFGDQYTPFNYIVLIFCLYYAIQSIGSFTGVLVTVLGKTKEGFIWNCLRVIIMASVCFLCRNHSFGYYVFAMTIGTVAIGLYPAFFLTIRKFIDLQLLRYVGVQARPAVISASLFVVCYYGLGLLLEGVPYIVTCSLIFIAGYITLSYIFNRDVLKFSLHILRN